MLIVNLYGGPGTGKSTTAAGTFAELKNRGHKVELVTEFAKDLCYEKSPLIKDQLYILAEMNRRFRRLQGQVDIAVTDCPILLGTIYGERWPVWFHDAVNGVRAQYDNLDIFLHRVKAYQKYGRFQDEKEAHELDHKIWHLLTASEWDATIPADRTAPEKVANLAEQALAERAQ